MVWAAVRDLSEVASTLDAIERIKFRKYVATLGAAVEQFRLLTLPKLDLMIVVAEMIWSGAEFGLATMSIWDPPAALLLMVNAGGGALVIVELWEHHIRAGIGNVAHREWLAHDLALSAAQADACGPAASGRPLLPGYAGNVGVGALLRSAHAYFLLPIVRLRQLGEDGHDRTKRGGGDGETHCLEGCICDGFWVIGSG